ncbi:PssD/Cps14F family polysaccharide biosynthesis glycosyltransferase [Arthrobacter castelli]|uniref:PssD/Cps14F family polysaccharide biosynthesis glycosyltransferase n=1 Tax=Arthrobacter castelli TaxID=271431 RepID=UPI001FDF7E2B|nr:PssD/Cps14F family polysaccharide biosynthesis glycosyltransferase [Arthrobacter castelli]
MTNPSSPASFRDMAPPDERHVLLIASTGGHLAQLLELKPWWQMYRRTWVTFDKADARSALTNEEVVFAHHPTTRNAKNAVLNFFLAVRFLLRNRPSLVVSTGAGVALPFFIVARLFNVPTIYLEVFDRVDTHTLSGLLCRPLASAFCVQWPSQQDLYPGSECIGTLL